MILPEDRKKVATLIVAKIGKPGMHEEKMSESMGNEDYHAVASDLMQAIESKDPAMLIEGLKAFISMCEAEPHEEGSQG